MNEQDINDLLIILNNADMKGNAAERFVELKAKLRALTTKKDLVKVDLSEKK